MKKLILLIIPLLVITFNQKSEAQVVSSQEELTRKDTLKAHFQKAQLLTKQGNTEEASKIYIRIMESYPDNRDAVQGWLMANMKRTPTGEEDAIKSLEDLSKLYPKNTGVIFFKAFIEGEYGHNEEALKDIDKLIKIQPDTALNYILKGQVLYAMEKYEEAFKAFDRATSLNPSFKEYARKDEDFKSLWDDQDFKTQTSQ